MDEKTKFIPETVGELAEFLKGFPPETKLDVQTQYPTDFGMDENSSNKVRVEHEDGWLCLTILF